MILGERQVDTFEAMLALTGFSRRPHELVADIVLAAIRESRNGTALHVVDLDEACAPHVVKATS